jgi:hypothetical protein
MTTTSSRILPIDDDVELASGTHAALGRAQEKVRALRLATKDFVHDFNNLLAVILANADFLVDQLGESDPRRLDAEAVRDAAQRAAGLTKKLFELGSDHRTTIHPGTA